MYQTRGAAWIGFEEAQKTINALKNEVEEAEKKLFKAKQVLKHDRGNKGIKFHNLDAPTVNSTQNISYKNELTSHFVKEVVPKQQPHLERLHKKRGKFTVPSAIKLSSDSEEQPNLVPSTVSSPLYENVKVPKISSSESANSYKNFKHKSSSSEKTSSLIADTYTDIGSKLSSIIDRHEKFKNPGTSKITFTPWEERFLKSYVDLSDVEVPSSQSEKPLENITNDMEWTPVLNGQKFPRKKKTTDDGFLSLKQIIDRQRRLHEQAHSNSEGGVSPSENIVPPLKSESDVKTAALKDLTYTDIESEAQVRPPPTRKVRLVTTLPRYRGFSVPSSFLTKKQQHKFKHTRKPIENIAVTKSTIIKNKQITPEENLQSKDPLADVQAEEKSDTNSSSKTSDILSKISSSKDKELFDSKISEEMILENDKENSHEDHTADLNVNSFLESEATLEDIVDKTKEKHIYPKFIPISKSVKRKAFKVHAEEKMAPSPKIRHYDTKAVRDYIKKKKAERRKRHLEEHKKSLEQAERKKESLQKLLDFQKQNIVLPATTKTISPTKIHQKKTELKNNDAAPQFSTVLHQNINKVKISQLDTTKESRLEPVQEKILDPPSNMLSKHTDLDDQSSKQLSQTLLLKPSQPQKRKERAENNIVDIELKTRNGDKILEIESESNKNKDAAVISLERKPNYSSQDMSVTSYEYQSTNLSDYISSINTLSELSLLPSFDEMLPQKLEKTNFPKVKLKQAEALKNLVKSIDEMTAPYEHLIRTRTWVEQSPPPPNRKSDNRKVREKLEQPSSSSNIIRSNTDFVVDVAKSLQSFDSSNFIQKVTGIGDTSELYEKILGRTPERRSLTSDHNKNTFQQVPERSSHSTIDHGIARNLFEGPLDSDEAHTTAEQEKKLSLEHSLIEGSLESESSLSIENGTNPHMDSRRGNTLLASGAMDICEFEAPKIIPDPYNFINTWNRKPLGIPLSSKDHLRSPIDPVKQDSKITNDYSNIQSDISKAGTSFSRSSAHSSFVSSITQSYQSSKRTSIGSSKGVNNNNNKSGSEISSHTSIHSSYTSFVSQSSTSKTVTSSSPVDKIDTETDSQEELNKNEFQTNNNQQENDKVHKELGINPSEIDGKAASPSESSVSEVVSVIANSRNGDKESTDNKSDASSRNGRSQVSIIDEEQKSDMVTDVEEYGLGSNQKDESSRNESQVSSIEEEKNSVTDIEEHEFEPTKNYASSKSGSLISSIEEEQKSITGMVEHGFETNYKSFVSEISPKSAEGSFLSEDLESKNSEELSLHENIKLKQSTENSEARQSPLQVLKTSDSAVSEHRELENISDVSAPSKNGVTIDFSQPLRFTLSNGVSKSLKVLKDKTSHEEQYLHTQVVTRVASEAAAAAASSAVIAVFETQKKLLSKEHESTRLLFPLASSSKGGHQNRSSSFVSYKTSSNSVASSNEDHNRFKPVSDDSVRDEVTDQRSSVSTVKEDLNFSNEDDNLSEHASISTKTSSSTIISEGITALKRSKEQKKIGGKKIASNLSSPSPASLSENDSISSAAIVSSNSAQSSSMLNESALSDDSFARLTEDVVRKMSYEEQRRANHQLAVLKFEEKTLVENARAQMTLLESIKKKLRDKGADQKASLIKKRQKELILRLRQERAQLRCMQEAYRSMCEMHHTILKDEKKYLHGQDVIAFQIKKSKERSHSSKTSSEPKVEASRIQSDSSSTSAVLTEEEAKDVEEVSELEILMKKATASSSHDSIIETVASEKTKSTISSHSQTLQISPTSFPQPKQGISPSNQSLHSNHSTELAAQGIKKLEASKRHLTKREQRILQRRKHVERLLQWQMKLDSEEMAVRELEQKALELVDNSKKKTKYYISSSPSATPNDNEKLSLVKIPNKPMKMLDDREKSTPTEIASFPHSTKSSAPKSIQSDSTPEENLATASGDSIDEVLSKKTSNEPDSSAVSSSSIQEVEKSQSPISSIRTAENTAESSCIEEVTATETSPKLKSGLGKDSNSDVYSESFESAVSQNTLSPASNSSVIRSSTPLPTSKKERNLSIKSPLGPRSSRRHDSSGSDDSYTISHSETASDQSDIEVRIHVLSEELRRRRYEAEKLKREQKRKYREHLKGTELSLQKQVEAYNHYIQQVKAELEQIESVPLQSSQLDISSVKPQIKWPRSEHAADSRRMRKKSMPSDPVRLEKRSIDHVSSSPESAESSLEFPIKQGKLLSKKLFPETKEKSSFEASSIKSILKEDSNKTPEISESILTDNSTLLNKVTKTNSDTSSKPPVEPKDETDIEELNESNSSISDKSNISVKEANSKITYQSDSFVSSSSTVSEIHKSSETLNKQEELVQEKASSANGNETLENFSEVTGEVHGDFETSHESSKTAFNESVHSSEEYSSVSSSNTITESVKEDIGTGSLEEDISAGSTTSPSKPSSDKTVSPKTELREEGTPDLSIAKKDNVVSEIGKPQLLEGLKSQTFIVNVVTYLSSSMLEDALRTVMNLVNNSKPKAKKTSECISKSNTFNMPSPSDKKLTEKTIQLITNDLLNIYIKDAFQSFFTVTHDLSNSKDRNICIPTTNNQISELDVRTSANKECTKPHLDEDLKQNLALTPVQEKVESNIFKKNSDWLEDGYITTPWDTQQLEQQLLLQQYPYLYRKIPNKPPPPYTPPATISFNSQHMFPLPVRREKPVEKVDPIKHVTKNLDLVLDCIVDCLIDGKRKGLMISDITQPNLSSVVEELDLRNPCQITFLDLIFDLTKDIALEIYNETEEKRAPWLRPRKLTPKPRFPTDKGKLKTTLLKELEKALKLLPTESYTERMRKKPTWATMKLGRKKRDFVDTILIKEIKEEEPDWVNYDQEEVAVKFQIADSVFDYLVDDTIKLIKNLEGKFHR